MVVEPNYIASPRYEAGNRSARMLQDRHKQQQCSDPSLIEALENFSSKLSHETLQAAYRHREKARWISSEGL